MRTSMGTFIHRDRIAERLEMARTMGLVTNYLVSPIGPARRPDACVRVWRSANATDAAVKDYLTRLLDGLVRDYEIVVTPAFPVSEPVPEISTQGERVDGPHGAPVSAAA
jgi:hypothetical protein